MGYSISIPSQKSYQSPRELFSALGGWLTVQPILAETSPSIYSYFSNCRSSQAKYSSWEGLILVKK
jgi:hypothetical protein